MIGKAEWTGGEANPRFIVTSLKPAEVGALHGLRVCAAQDRLRPHPVHQRHLRTIRLKLLKIGALVRVSVRR